MKHASLTEGDDVETTLLSHSHHITRTRRSKSIANNSGSFPRIRQHHQRVIRGLEEMPRKRIGQDQARVLYQQFGQSAVPRSFSRTLWWSKIRCNGPIVEGGLIAGGSISQKRGQACFFTTADLMNVLMLTPRFEENEPRMIPYRMKWRSAQNRKYWFDLRIVEDKRLAFYQSKSNAILSYNRQDLTRREIIANLTRQVLQSSNREKLMG